MTGEWLTVSGNGLMSASGQPIVLRGVAIGGWMSMENFITGHPATEQQVRAALAQEVGPERAARFFDRFLEAFYGDEDARFLASLGFNCVRLPINYRHFEDDLRPFELKADGFRHLDRAVRVNARHGLYSVINLHDAQGYQNHDWHCDNIAGRPLLWGQKCFQDRLVWLWEQIARHYRDDPWVAGYNLVNEPADEDGSALGPLYRRLVDAIRAIDLRHALFLDGNMYAQEFEVLGEAIPGAVYALHHYPEIGTCGHGCYPGTVAGVTWDREAVERQHLARSAYMRRRRLPVWVGEFGPVYEGDDAVDASRLRLLRDQLEIYDRAGASWSAWTYKDIGVQGVVHLDPESDWMRATRPLREKKRRLAADIWGVPGRNAAEYMAPIESMLAREFGEEPGDFSRAAKLVRARLVADALVPEFAACFRGLGDDQLERLAESFRFGRCVIRTELGRSLPKRCAMRDAAEAPASRGKMGQSSDSGRSRSIMDKFRGVRS